MLLNILALAAAAGQATPDDASFQALYEARMSTLVQAFGLHQAA